MGIEIENKMFFDQGFQGAMNLLVGDRKIKDQKTVLNLANLVGLYQEKAGELQEKWGGKKMSEIKGTTTFPGLDKFEFEHLQHIQFSPMEIFLLDPLVKFPWSKTETKTTEVVEDAKQTTILRKKKRGRGRPRKAA